jgi:hypothetical protein
MLHCDGSPANAGVALRLVHHYQNKRGNLFSGMKG